MFKKTAILLFTAVSFIFASGSMERSRFLDTDFIDIGTKNGIAENVIAQQFMNIPAKTKLLDEILDFKPRKYETYKCQVDDEGGETCPKDVTACTVDPKYASGYSERKSGVYTDFSSLILKRMVQSGLYMHSSFNQMNIIFIWNEKESILFALIFAGNNDGYVLAMDRDSNQLDLGTIFWLKIDNRFKTQAQIFLATDIVGEMGKILKHYNTHTFSIDLNQVYKTDIFLNVHNVVPFLIEKGFFSKTGKKITDAGIPRFEMVIKNKQVPGFFYNFQQKQGWSPTSFGFSMTEIDRNEGVMSVCPRGGYVLQHSICVSTPYDYSRSHIPYKIYCPKGFEYDDKAYHCKKHIEYTYYDYKCPANVGEIDPSTGKPYPDWQGPRNKGGDCGGIGLNSKKECNSETPPSNNCFRGYYFCPFDKERPCFKKPTENKIVDENKIENYIYSPGEANNISKKLTSNPICPNGGIFDIIKFQCEKRSEAKCPEGFIQSPYDDLCVKKLTEKCIQTDENGKCIKKEFENCQGDFVEAERPGDSNLCFIEKIQDCPEGYIKDFQNKCIKQAECPNGYILTNNGICELNYSYTQYTCPAGYEDVGSVTNVNSDCHGLCGYDGCLCNSVTPPANGCRKKTTENYHGTYDITKKSPMIVHNVTTSIDYKIPNENFSTINIPCNYDVNTTKRSGICQDNINLITGQDERLCFKKGNGQEFCYNVAGCRFSGQISSDKITDLFLERDLKTISSKSATGSIKSTCRLNGNVGYSPRDEGITSVSPKLGSQKYVTIKAKGNAKTSNGTWSGFNIATMAIQLSDGNWYTLDAAYDNEGKRIARNVPDFVLGLNFSSFKVTKQVENCEIKGKKVTAYCGEEVILYMPNPDLGVIGVAELDSLDDDKDKTDNALDLTVVINGIKMPLTKSINAIDNNPFVVKPISPVTEYSDRLNFWDSYMDGDIGFIEFVREVAEPDKKEKFIPENTIPYEMSEIGFTNIEYSSANEKAEEYVQGKTEIVRKETKLVEKEAEKLAVERFFWNTDHRYGPFSMGKARRSSYRNAEFMRKICNNDFRQEAFGANFCLAHEITDSDCYTGPIKDTVTINNHLKISRTDVSGFSKVDVYEINGVIDKKIFLNKIVSSRIEDAEDGKYHNTFYDFFRHGGTHHSTYNEGEHTSSGGSYSLLLAQCYQKGKILAHVCPESYELKELDGKPICEKKAVSCPAGYVYTGKEGKKACRKALVSGTFFVSSDMSNEACESNAKKLKGAIILFSELPYTLINYGKSLLHSGATKDGCVIRVNHQTDFQSNIYAVKTLTYNNNFEYVCSKWSCAGGSCKIGICPTFNTTIGKENKPMEYQGKIIPKDLEGKLSQEACLEQECDANKEHAGVCGLKFQPSTSLSKGVFFQDGKFYQAYCDEKDAVLSDDGATCIVKRCPEGTIKQTNGTCKKK